VRIGGSRAQRDLVEHTLLAAYLKAGRPAGGGARLIARRGDRRATVAVTGFTAGRFKGTEKEIQWAHRGVGSSG
jgi:hypothetical protein